MDKYLIFITLLAATAMGAEETPQNPRMVRFNESFTRTGEIENCIHLSRIRSSRVLDDEHIVFRLHGNRYYLNTLPRRCPRLGVVRSFAFATSLSKLCDVDTIVAFDDIGQFSPLRGPWVGALKGPRCGLGKFERVDRSADSEQGPD